MWIQVTSGRKHWDARDSTDWDQCLAWVLSWARRVHLANGTVATSDCQNLWIRVWWIGRVERSTHGSKRRFLEIFSVQRGPPRESDTASRREEACFLKQCYVVAQLVTSQPAVDLTLTCLGPSRITRKTLASSNVHSAVLYVLCCFPLLQDRYLSCLFREQEWK